MNKTVMYGIVAVAIVLLLIYRKKIFKELAPTVADLKKKIIAGDGLTKTQERPAGSFIKGTEGERISNMLKDAASKYSVRDLEAATRDWSLVNQGVDRTLMDSLNLTSRPTSVNDILTRPEDGKNKAQEAIADIGRIVRNQVVITDLWGHPCYCACGCRDGFKGKSFSFNYN